MVRRTGKANLGMDLEDEIIKSNLRYASLGLALIHKVPTPIQIVKKSGRKITEAFFLQKSTVDFEGNLRGRFIAFDTKETKKVDEFPLKNVENHQFEYLAENHKQQGISFLLVRFASHHENYIITFEQLKEWWRPGKSSGLGSVPYVFFKENCPMCLPGRNIAIDYLEALEKECLKL